MRKIMIVLFLYCSAYSQEHYKISDANFKKLIAVNDEVAKNVKLVESSLNSNQNKLVLGSVEIFDPYIDVIKKPLNKLSDKQQKKINDLVCIECYETWYQQQLTAKNKIIENSEEENVFRHSNSGFILSLQSMTQEGAKSFADQIANDAKTEWTYKGSSESTDGTKCWFSYMNGKETFNVIFKIYYTDENKALEIPGVKTYKFYQVSGSYLDLFPTWKKVFRPDADLEATVDDLKSQELLNKAENINFKLKGSDDEWQLRNWN